MESTSSMFQEFPTSYEEILHRIASLDPITYGITRNYTNGAVSRLSPYVSRGVVSTQFVTKVLRKKGYALHTIEKFIQELAWRDYWQRFWQVKGAEINTDLRQKQQPVRSQRISSAILNASTGINAIDDAIHSFYNTGYLHNHVRMYIAAIACNMGHNHWKHPAQWMYYHLLDADWASNALSWQWVAGSNANKKYYCNQANINRFFDSQQKGTFLDCDYEQLYAMDIPKALKAAEPSKLHCSLPTSKPIELDNHLPTLIYNYYNLDPYWKSDINANRILLIEPDFFDKYPVSDKCMQFFLQLANNIDGIQMYVGSFASLKSLGDSRTFYYKEHPDNLHYEGIEEDRIWLSSTTGWHRSFFSFWKKCKKELKF